MQFKKILLVDSYSYDSFHEMFNACLLKILDNIFEDVSYISSLSQKECTYKILLHHKISLSAGFNFRKIFVLKDNGKYSFLMKCIFSALYNSYFLISSKKDTCVLFNINNALFLPLLLLVNKFIKRNILIINHGELEYLRYGEKGNNLTALSVFFGRLLKFYINRLSKYNNIKFIVLSDDIKDNIQKYTTLSPDNIIVIEHPYIFANKIKLNAEQQKSNDLTLGIIGYLNQSKGLLSFLELLNKHEWKNIRWLIIGRCMPLIKHKNLDIYGDNNLVLSRDKFDYLVSKVDYITYFYSNSTYKLTVSGSVFDAINYEKPIIGLGNDYFKYLFKKYGDFGFLCDDIDSLYATIVQSKINSSIVSHNFSSVFLHVKNAHSIDTISNLLKIQLLNLKE